MVSIIFKPIEACNSKCNYCDVIKLKKPLRISEKTTISFLKKINNFLLRNPDEKIDILWHGGEPLLLGKEYFNYFIKNIKSICHDTIARIKHSMQTNLLLLDEDFAKILTELEIQGVGTSFDPIPGVRHSNRSGNFKHYTLKFLNAVNILERYNINWGFIYVVTKPALKLPKELLIYSGNINSKFGINVHPVEILEDDNPFAITPDEFAVFLGEMFLYWFERQKKFLNVEPFGSYMRIYFKNERMNGCETSGDCSKNRFYLGPEGNTSHCGKCGIFDTLDYGNINDLEIEDILENPLRHIFSGRSEILLRGKCKDCRYWDICRGGCPLDAYYKSKDFQDKTYWCESKKIFLENYFEPKLGFKKDFYN